MRKKFLFFELLLTFLITLRALFPEVITSPLYLLLSVSLFALKALYEGFRLHWLLFALAGIFSIPNISILQYLAVLTILFSVLYFPLFHDINLTGSFLVGYKEAWLDNDKLHVSIFYPTLDEGQDSLQFAGNIPPWKNFYESMRLIFHSKTPSWYIRIALSYLNHWTMGVNTNVPIINEFSTAEKAFPVIIFSHGLGANRNAYSFYLKEWASRGFIVLSADHKDLIYPPSRQAEDFAHRNSDLKKRLKDQQNLLDFVLSPSGLKKMFSREIEIDQGRISSIGHSYGGCSAAYFTLMDQRVTGACICLDPYYLPLEEEVYRAMNRPLLVIITAGFDETFAKGNNERIRRLTKLNEDFKSQTMVCSFEGGKHNNLADNGLFMAREMVLIGGLSPIALIGRLYRNNASLIEAFLETTVLEKKKGRVVTRENLLEKFKEKKHHPEIQLIQEDLAVK